MRRMPPAPVPGLLAQRAALLVEAAPRGTGRRPYMVRNDPARALELAGEYRAAIKAAVLVALPSTVAQQLVWSRSIYPSLANPELLADLGVAGLGRVRPEVRRFMFLNDAGATLLEVSDGVWPALERASPVQGRRTARSIGAVQLFSAPELLQVFNDQILPAQLQVGSRVNYWSGWRQVLTFGLAHGELHKILPMSMGTLRSLTAEFLLLGTGANTVRNVWSAIEDRHRMAHLAPPLAGPLVFKRSFKAICAVRGAPSRTLFPVGPHHLRRLLLLAGLSNNQQRAVIITVLGTVMCCRVSELANLQLCDLLWDFDAPYHEDLLGGLAIRIYKRKQDTGRFGLYPRVPPGELVIRLKQFITDLGLRVSNRCTKKRAPGGRCKFCDPVFPHAMTNRATVAGGRLGDGAQERAPLLPISRQQVSGAVKLAFECLGVDTTFFCGLSMRRGGITAATQARVPEPILFRQSGHGTALAGRRYVDPVDPRVLYATGRAILLEGST